MSRFQCDCVPGSDPHAAPLELFHDLVSVFAITQVSRLLLDHLTREGAGQAPVALLVGWWASEDTPRHPVAR